MCYTEEQIKRYLDILHNYGTQRSWVNYTNQTVESRKTKCCNCQRSDCFSVYSGYKICVSCGSLNGHVLGYYDQKDYSRLHYRNKRLIKFLKDCS